MSDPDTRLSEIQAHVDQQYAEFWEEFRGWRSKVEQMNYIRSVAPDDPDTEEFQSEFAHAVGQLIGYTIFAPLIWVLMRVTKVIRLIGPLAFVTITAAMIGSAIWWLFGGASPWTFAASVSMTWGGIILLARWYTR
jgi:hypothetical protein